MPAAPIPDNEAWRLAALLDLDVLDTGPNAALDAIVRAASLVCGSPMTLISLVDENRQWFKANIGLEGVTETPRDVSFCAHAILAEDILDVEDTTLDPRFADNPLVTGTPYMRAYAGAPLILQDGSKVGTLCAIHDYPRKLSPQQKDILTELATAVARSLEQARNLKIQGALGERLRECADMLELISQP
jgi:GAF domain-containing protein